jgi:hypothetical protein
MNNGVSRAGRMAGALLFFQVIISCGYEQPVGPRLIVSPAASSVAVGEPQVFVAELLTADGTTQPLDGVRFSASGGTIDARGEFVAGQAVGRFTVIAVSSDSSLSDTVSVVVTPSSAKNFTTRFAGHENPISEGGRWLNGGTDGLDWANVSSEGGMAIGHQVGPSGTDGTAILTGDWGGDQMAIARARVGPPNEDCFQELELRLRSTMRPHHSSGYEIFFKATSSEHSYLAIVRWNGPLGNFTYLLNERGRRYGIKTGDVIAATAIGDTITAYRNGVPLGRAVDTVFRRGNPGVGFNLLSRAPGCAGTNGDYGFTSFTATDFIPE